jgi:ubiquinone/menaquinone biosynthesis C-methylase UbiE
MTIKPLLQSFVAEPIVDLSVSEEAFFDIYSPESELGQARTGVTDQFLDNAQDYHERYADVGYWSMLLDVALTKTDIGSPGVIIDIGSGSGNSVLPLLSKYPRAHVVASDISPNLLAILRDYCEKNGSTKQRLSLLCADASKVRFAPCCADLVVGAAILHHIIEPKTVLERAFVALKPGGWAIFFEPFRAGSSLLTLAYKQVLRHKPENPVSAIFRRKISRANDGLDVLARIVHDYDTRVVLTSGRAETLDDKWMFERAQFESAAIEQGWGKCESFSLQDGKKPVRNQTVAYLRLAAGLDESSLPDWAWSILDEFDHQLSDDVRASAWMEGMILFRKPGASTSANKHLDTNHFNRWYWCDTLDRQGVFLAQKSGVVMLHWCGFDNKGRAMLYSSHLTQENEFKFEGNLGDSAFSIELDEDSMFIAESGGEPTKFDRFLVGEPIKHAAQGVYLSADSRYQLLVESRAGSVHSALIDSHSAQVFSGGLQSSGSGWSGTLTEYDGGSAPFASQSLAGSPTSRTISLSAVSIDQATVAVSINNERYRICLRE